MITIVFAVFVERPTGFCWIATLLHKLRIFAGLQKLFDKEQGKNMKRSLKDAFTEIKSEL